MPTAAEPMATPTLGLRSLTEAVLALRGQGFPASAIAKQIGRSEANVRSLERYGVRTSKRSAGIWRPEIPIAVQQALLMPAARRGIDPSVLARRILVHTIEANLIDAVLDDGCPAREPHHA